MQLVKGTILWSLLLSFLNVAYGVSKFDYHHPDHPQNAIFDKLRNRLHGLQIGVLKGNILNKNAGADARLSRAKKKLERVRNYLDAGDSRQGLNNLFQSLENAKHKKTSNTLRDEL